MSLERTEHINSLTDAYALLLRSRQQDLLRLYFAEDYSLAEIAELYGISRQAVHDALHRAVKTLEGFEATLGIVQQRRSQQELQEVVAALIKRLPPEATQWSEVQALLHYSIPGGEC